MEDLQLDSLHPILVADAAQSANVAVQEGFTAPSHTEQCTLPCSSEEPFRHQSMLGGCESFSQPFQHLTQNSEATMDLRDSLPPRLMVPAPTQITLVRDYLMHCKRLS